jgi:hypothetical protein
MRILSVNDFLSGNSKGEKAFIEIKRKYEELSKQIEILEEKTKKYALLDKGDSEKALSF